MSVPVSVLMLAPSASVAVLDVLTDWSAMGLVQPFCWVRPENVMAEGSIPALRVEAGLTYATTVQQTLQAASGTRVRLGVLVPLEEEGVASPDDEDTLLSAIQAAGGASSLSRARLLLPRGPTSGPAVAERYGWQSVVVAPEVAQGPRRAVRPRSVTAGPSRVAHEAAAAASLLGLWQGPSSSPLDDAGTGQLRLGRTEVRRWSAEEAQHSLQDATFATTRGVPLPRSSTGSVVFIENVAGATSAMAEAVWAKHKSRFVQARRTPQAPARQNLGIWQTIKLFLTFLFSGLLHPGQWLRGRLALMRSALAGRVERALLGDNSAYKVVWGKQLAGLDLDHLEQVTDSLGLALQHEVGLKPLEGYGTFPDVWQDYVAGAMTLMDAAGRGPCEPIQLGHQTGILRRPMECIPGSEQAFTDLDPSLDVEPELRAVEAFDPLAHDRLRFRLQAIGSEGRQGSQAARSLRELEQWEARAASSSYAAQFGGRLAGVIRGLRTYVENLSNQLATLGQEPSDNSLQRTQRRVARRLRTVLAVLGAVIAVLVVIGAVAILPWAIVLAVLGASLLVGLITAFGVFYNGQRTLFRILHEREALAEGAEIMAENLQAALRDLRRAVEAYRQFIAWSRATRTFLNAPFGPRREAQSNAHVPQGLPDNVRVGQLAYSDIELRSLAAQLRESVFRVGWLQAPWDRLIAGAGAAIGPEALRITREPSALFAERSGNAESSLDAWVRALGDTGIDTGALDGVWAEVRSQVLPQILNRETTGEVTPNDGPASSLVAFVAEIGDSALPGPNFDAGWLPDEALIYGRNQVTGLPFVEEVEDAGRHHVTRVEFSAPLQAGDVKYQTTAGVTGPQEGELI